MCLFLLRVMGGQILSQKLSVLGGNPPWKGHPSITGHITYTHTHSDWVK